MVRVQDMHDLFKVYEVENIIQCATFSALASQERKESRWGLWHHRSDYPDKDDKNWLKHIVLTAGDRPENVKITHKKIEKLEKERQ